MEAYKNLKGDSGISRYQIGDDFIIIEFGAGHLYLYNYTSTGKAKIERMKVLAKKGKGLSTYISRHVKDHYAEKL